MIFQKKILYHCRSLQLQYEDWIKREKVSQLERTILEAGRFSAFRVFSVDRTTLLGVASTIVTFLIILLQTKGS
jgi:hypothetical protein